MSRDQQGVVELPAAGVPADQGLTSLGLVMQLAGTILALGVALLAFVRLVSLTDRHQAIYMFLVLASCVVRSLLHRMAGTELLYGKPGVSIDAPIRPLGGLRRYVVVGVVHSVAFALALVILFDTDTSLALGLGLGLAVWPATLGLLMLTGLFARFEQRIPVSEDKGFEGASILMTVLGICGALAAAAVLLAMFELGGRIIKEGTVIILMLAVVMLLVRSILHAQAGLSGLRTTSIDRSVELANRYASFGVISSFCTGGAMMLIVMTGRLDVGMFAVVTGVTWMLMAWPMIVRRFFGDRQFADLLAGEGADVHRRAPDAGLTGLGWLLLAHAAYGASMVIPTLVTSDSAPHSRELDLLFQFAEAGGRSPWWTAGICVLEAWAGYELIRMTAHHKIISMVYAVIGSGVTLYIYWPAIHHLDHASQQQMLAVMPLAIALVIPASVLVLVNRNIAPAARARFRKA